MIVHPKMISSFNHPQVVQLNTKEDILKNIRILVFHTILVSGVHQQLGYPYSSKYLLLCLAEDLGVNK